MSLVENLIIIIIFFNTTVIAYYIIYNMLESNIRTLCGNFSNNCSCEKPAFSSNFFCCLKAGRSAYQNARLVEFSLKLFFKSFYH